MDIAIAIKRTYSSWQSMLDRCCNPNSHSAHRYSKRDITVCERWKRFENFLADMGERPFGKTLDRINNLRGYEPNNCRWATPAQQTRNRRNTKLTFETVVEIPQRRLCGEKLQAIAGDYGVLKQTVSNITRGKIWKGATIEAAFELALDKEPWS